MKTNRREVLAGAALGVLAGCAAPKKEAAAAKETPMLNGEKKVMPLELKDFQPKSMLHVRETRVPKSRFPVIDMHTHLTFAAKSKNGVSLGEEGTVLDPPENLLKVMDAKNIHTLVNLTGGVGAGLRNAIAGFDKTHPGRFLTLTEPRYDQANRPDYPKYQADEIAAANKEGARGLKVLKTLGLYLRENVTEGPLVKVDDKRFDPMWEQCGALKMPVWIHVADPEAFFLPTDRFNERFEELNNHADWSFYGKDFPKFQEILDALLRVVARHPKTQFIGLHVGCNAENLVWVSQAMDKYPNLHVEIGARIGELGRQPRTSRKFFERYQDRIMFGTDAVPHGDDTPQQVYGELLYEIYYRFLETEDEYFDYAPAPVPPQGRWQIYGLGLPDGILRKVYNGNAQRLMNFKI